VHARSAILRALPWHTRPAPSASARPL
jgi:hypothetical protein